MYLSHMKTLLILLTLFSLYKTQDHSITFKNITIVQKEQFITQKLDHFNPLDTRTWTQRYFVLDHFFVPTQNPLIILFICGEYECIGVPPNRTFPLQLAEDFNALILILEHRFYGKSQPFGQSTQSYSDENLKFLSAQQALSDLAWFIHQVKETGLHNVNPVMPWVTIGGSYPGALSAWFRSKFPHLTIGALASSAVVQPILDFWQFDQQVADSLKKSEGCSELVFELNQFITEILQQGSSIEKFELKNLFNSTLLDDGDFAFFFSDITVEGVQYGNRKQMCSLLLNKFKEGQNLNNYKYQMNGVLQALKQFADQSGTTPDQYGVYYLRNTTYNQATNARQWYHQSCSEFGFYFTPSSYPMRSIMLDINYWNNWCSTAYQGAQPNVESTNNFFGGVDLQATNLIFTNGIEDPWQWASKRSSNQSDIQAYVADCDQCAHCVDLVSENENDSENLKFIRKQIVQSFSQWRQEYYQKVQEKEMQSLNNYLRKNNFKVNIE